MTLEKQYKNKLSEFREFEEEKELELENEIFVFPENFSEDMAIDETGLNGELYTIILNKKAKGKKWSLAALIKGTKAEKIVSAVFDKVKTTQLMQIKEMTLDLANNMDRIVRQICPNGLHTYDRFHVQKLVTEAVQTIRIRHRWQAIKEEEENVLKARNNKQKFVSFRYNNGDTKKQLLARSRYLLYKPQNKWSKWQQERAKILFKEFPNLKKAYNLSMYFRNCYEYGNNVYRFKKWIKKVNDWDINELKVVATTIESKLWWIMNYFHNKATNANIEWFHSKLKLFRQQTRWVIDNKFFFFRIIKYFA